MSVRKGTKNLRVLMATPRYFPLTGGVEMHVYEVSRRLAERGVEVTVLTTNPQNELAHSETSEGVKVRRVRTWPAQRDYYFAPKITHEILAGKWDVVHCQGVHTLVPPMAMLASKRAGTPYVVTFHTGGHSSGLRNAVRGAQWRALRPLLKGAAQLVGVSRFEAEYFRDTLALPEAQFRVIPNGGRLPAVDLSQGNESSEGIQEKLLVSVGRLERYKGHHRLILALPYVLKKYPQTRVMVLGDGPYREELLRIAERAGVGDRVEIKAVPSGDREAMSRILTGASVVTLLSEYESQGIAVVEAIALGRPTLVAHTTGLMEFADRGLARSIPIDSESEIVAKAIIQQIEDPLMPASVALPTWEECTDSLMDLYKSVARRQQCVS